MSCRRYLTTVVLALVAGGCIPSVYPLYTQKDLVTDGRLVGTWFSAKRGATLSFKPGKDKSYDLVLSEKGKTDHLEARLVRLGDHMFLDTYPGEEEAGSTDFYRAHLVFAHQFSKVTLQQNTLVLEFVNLEYIAKQAKLRSEGEHESHVLTVPTKDVQAALVRYVNDKKALENMLGTLVRQQIAGTSNPASSSR